jgi:hypothetical protein
MKQRSTKSTKSPKTTNLAESGTNTRTNGERFLAQERERAERLANAMATALAVIDPMTLVGFGDRDDEDCDLILNLLDELRIILDVAYEGSAHASPRVSEMLGLAHRKAKVAAELYARVLHAATKKAAA